ncbi:hypothetical protein GGI25_004170 [Coemansia spiralis]|uniref:RTA1 like protein n=2 Tax=Coemansia TaxID=4863 RepID=A0A9W8KVU9_9FUNG|nr:RTA1 like protein-domain-containing protein [Coemansia spiralis]KAJ1987873.1 hypothetical protein EDC05_005604 [Coemansia umbellata]KAJ2620493.1 hypothetical protein GGI26_004981 [Coemansia sp. RSA 1358]KAJ2675022.1 hypothetical protein GGI25_004170 [Coemansia spiralis]
MAVDPTYYFSYTPVNIAPEVIASVFLILTATTLVQTIKSRAPLWLLILPATALSEALGYAFRTVCIYWTTLGTFTAMSLLLLLPPNALALTNYKTLGLVAQKSNLQGPVIFIMRPKFITWFFFISDVFSFVLQGLGVAISTKEGKRDLAKYTVLAGLFIQLVFFAAFFFIAVKLYRDPQYTVQRGPRDLDRVGAKKRLFRVILGTTVLLYIRGIYRVAEFVGGYGSKVYGTEWLFYLFDTSNVLVCFAIYIESFIGYHFQRRRSNKH